MIDLWAISNELYHHGTKGQKWGIRNYQNQDGSLTAAGEARYLVGGDSAYGRGRSIATTSKSVASKKPLSRTVKNPSRTKSSIANKKTKTNEDWQTPGERLKNKYKNDKKFRFAINTAAKAAVVAGVAVGTKYAVGSMAAKKGAKIMDDLKSEGILKKVTNDNNSMFKDAYHFSREAIDEYDKRMGKLGKINKIIN